MSRLETYRGYSTPVIAGPSVSLLYQISYMYYTLLGTLVGLSIGVAVSLATEMPNPCNLDTKYFYHRVHRFLPKRKNAIDIEEKCKMIELKSVVS